MKIAHLISGGETGGSKNHLLSLLASFPKVEVTLIAMQKGELYEQAKEQGIDVQLLDQSSRYDLKVLTKLKNFIKENGYDLLHTHGPRANLYGALIIKKLNIPWVTTIHSDPKLDFLKGGLKGKIFTKINLWSIKRIDHFFAVSERFKQDLMDIGIPGDRVSTIYNGIDFSKSYAKTNLSREDLQLKQENFVIAMVARLHPIKGHHEVFEAMQNLSDPNVQLLLIGDGPEREDLQKKAKELNIQNQVHFLGFRDDVPDIYQISDIGLLASYSESFPLALLEAAREKTPVIATNVGGIPHMLEDTGWIIEPKDSQAITNALQEAIQEKEERTLTKRGEDFHNHASQNFSLEQLAEATKKMYKKIKKS
ncbi:glycosyltransferase family 4 protein [Pontibacillus marinus]|uniref:Glycosyl transferase n=1 Tax=Pontibacillus marinus BH030004 = DSM 16465 TaxID=1385511 RepID=A0A0A5GIE2_9BACI|nr:glycosyltransferase family 4 protein [Pontibacillus marinus]KGX90983.1 glycosyl transferase [Pontibacillus marinus BH030004 = DSM 16465]